MCLRDYINDKHTFSSKYITVGLVFIISMTSNLSDHFKSGYCIIISLQCMKYIANGSSILIISIMNTWCGLVICLVCSGFFDVFLEHLRWKFNIFSRRYKFLYALAVNSLLRQLSMLSLQSEVTYTVTSFIICAFSLWLAAIWGGGFLHLDELFNIKLKTYFS